MTAKIFIDGEAGTTGLGIRARLAGRTDLRVISIEDALRKDVEARRERLNDADIVILCLPDDAAREAAALVENPATRIIDASTAHRTADGWIYGFPEMAKGQRAAIAGAARLSNPGCYATGFIALARPLVDRGLLPRDWPVTVNGISGYTGGGKAMIAEFEGAPPTEAGGLAVRVYALARPHKHAPEMRRHAGLTLPPLFAPTVGRFAQGMIVEVPLQLMALPGAPSVGAIHAALADAYAGERFVEVAPLAESRAMADLRPEGLNGTNRMRLFVFGQDDPAQARLIALLDNLGKGASGAAVQNLNLMLGVSEASGL